MGGENKSIGQENWRQLTDNKCGLYSELEIMNVFW